MTDREQCVEEWAIMVSEMFDQNSIVMSCKLPLLDGWRHSDVDLGQLCTNILRDPQIYNIGSKSAGP